MSQTDIKHISKIDYRFADHAPEVSIITVNYHSIDQIRSSFHSIEKQTQNHAFEYLIASNSPIKNKDDLKEQFFNTKLIELGQNLGFAKANNIAAGYASGTYLFFLNPDTRFENDVLHHLIQAHETYPSAGILGPQTLDENGNITGSIKNDLSFLYLLHEMAPFIKSFTSSENWYGKIEKHETDFVDVVNGSALFIPREVFYKVGEMNESFFMYWEENDLCLRARNMRFNILFVSEAHVRHIGKTTTRKNFLPMEIERHRSRKKYIAQHLPHLVILNRIIGIISYSWRLVGSLITFRFNKIQQFGALFYWYLFRYK